MRYCAQCGSEYVDETVACADCGGKELLTVDELKQRNLPLPGDEDTRRFVRAATAEDPLTAEQYSRVLDEASIPCLSRPRRSGTVDILSGASAPWWEILVPEELADRAARLVAEERLRMEQSADEAGQAAEEEEANSETLGKTPGA